MTSPQKPVDYYYRHYEYQSHPAQQPLGNSSSTSSLASSSVEQSPSHAQRMHPYVYGSQSMYNAEHTHPQSQSALSTPPGSHSAQLASQLPPHSSAQPPVHPLTSSLLASPVAAQQTQMPVQLSPHQLGPQMPSQVASQMGPPPQHMASQPQQYRKDSYPAIAPSRSQPALASHVSAVPQMHQALMQGPKSHGQGYNANYGGQAFAYIPATPQPTRRRSLPKLAADISYPVNFPAHPVPPHMRVPTGPPNSWTVMPPRPEEVRTRRYASGVDERNFFSVLEYEINSQAIIWDYYTGYVHLTGIWKAIGNSKADIVKLLDNSPELEPVIKRVRGGFLKIQGTWVPYDVARRLAIHVCYYVRFALVPLFGPDFPDQCTKPNEPMFGLLQLTMPPKKEGPSKAPRPFQSHQQPAGRSSESPNCTQPSTPTSMGKTPTTPLHAQVQGPTSVGAPTPIAQVPGVPNAVISAPGFPPVGVPLAYSPPAKHAHLHVLPHNHHHHSHSHHSRRQSDSGFKQRGSFNRSRTNSLTPIVPIRKDLARKSSPVSSELYDENVFEDDDAESISPPPMPRKVSFSDEQKVSGSPSEFIAMLKATRSLQQMSTGKPVKESGGDFECAGRQFVWDGSDRLDMLPFRTASTSTTGSQAVSAATSSEDLVKLKQSQMSESLEVEPKKPEPTPPIEPSRDRRLPSLATILNV